MIQAEREQGHGQPVQVNFGMLWPSGDALRADGPRLDSRMKKITPLVYLLLALAASAAPAAEPADDGMLDLLQGEFALQQGDAKGAAAGYVEAAEASKDPALAERAAQIAIVAEDFDAARRALDRWHDLQPDAPGLLSAEARLALKRGDRIAAVSALRRLLAKDETWSGAVQALAASGQSPILGDVLTELVSGNALPSNIDAWMAFGGLAQRLQLKTLGAELARRAVDRFPKEPRAWLWQAEMAQQREDKDGARAAIARAVALGPLDTATRLGVAAQLDALGDSRAAAAALAGGTQDDTTFAGRAAYLARANDKAALDELYQLAAQDAATATDARLYLLGQLAELLEKSDLALQWYGKVKAGLQRDQAQLRIAVLLDKVGKLDDGIARLRELQAGDSEYGEVLRDAYLLEAELLLRHERGEDALDAYARGLRIFEDDPELIYARALAYERLDRLPDAEADLRKLIELDPDNADAMNALGYTLADRTDRYDEALKLIQRALELRPDTPAIIDSLGWVLHRLGRTEEALPHLRRAFEMQRDAEVAAHLGEALWAHGDKDEARSIWRLGREIDPDNRALKQALEKYPE
jgi:tetratricopeptide (TPR) repeat protein